MKLKIIAPLILVVISGLLLFSNEFNRANIFGSFGFIESGEKFGIAIGQDQDDIERSLRRRGIIRADRTSEFQGCYHHSVSNKMKIQYYQDATLRKGTICLAYLNRKVAAIGWRYGWLDP